MINGYKRYLHPDPLIKQVISLCLLVLFLGALVPGDYYHELAGHPTHHCIQHRIKTFESQHHHCDLQKIQLCQFLIQHQPPRGVISIHHVELRKFQPITPGKQNTLQIFLRAPPEIS